MKTNLKFGCKAEYKLIRRKAVTNEHGERVPGPVTGESGWSKNILTLHYFNSAMTVGALRVRGIVVGAGTTAANETQSTLVSYLASTTSNQAFSVSLNPTSSPRSVTKEWRYRFGEGVAAGNVAEVGMVATDTGSNITSATLLCSRARIVDGSGNPTTVTVLSDEFLDVIWRYTVFVPEDITGSANISIDGVPTLYNYTIRAIAMNSTGSGSNAWWNSNTIGVCPTNFNNDGFSPVATANSTLLNYTDNGPVTANSQGVFSAEAYTTNSKNRTFRITWPLNNANVAIRSIFCKSSLNDGLVYMMGQFQILLDAPINKVNTKTLMLQVNIAMDNV